MKRDWDTVRVLLTRIEELRTTDHYLSLNHFKKDEAYCVSYHMNLLIEQGLVDGEMNRQINSVLESRMRFMFRGPIDFHASGLTWEGMIFLTLSTTIPCGTKLKRPLRPRDSKCPLTRSRR